MRRAFQIARFFAPWVWGVIRFTCLLVAVTMVSFWRGVPQNISLIASEWQVRANNGGFPMTWNRELYYVLWALAFVTVILGWVVLSYITVWLVGSIL